MSEILKEALADEALESVTGGKYDEWTPNKCHGKVIGEESHSYRNNSYKCYVYKVAYGDTLSQIALSLTVDGSYTKLAIFNGITNPDVISVNQTIYCPKGAYKV